VTVLVDTSVWADFFNGYPSTQAETLAALLAGPREIATCGVIAAEFLQGIRQPRHVARLEDVFRRMIWLEPRGRETFFDAARLYRDLRARGITVRSTIDCLVVCLARENDCLLLARDRDLRYIVGSGLTSVRFCEPEARGR
jgi:predicted nucleic acid-binding protein